MDVLEHLVQEHRQAAQMLEQLARSEPGPARQQTVDELDAALTKHMAVEEQWVYPIVERVMGEEPEVEAETEHELAREGLEQLRQLVEEPGFGAAVAMLQAGIRHHVQEEEQEVFPQLRDRAGEELAQLDPERLEHDIDLRPSRARSRRRKTSSRGSGASKQELYERAKKAGIPGRSDMTKDELERALSRAGG